MHSRALRRVAALAALVMFGAIVTVTQVSAAHTGGQQDQQDDNDEAAPRTEILSDSCDDSSLPPHNGFADSGRTCVDTEAGSVGLADENPTLLIVSAPQSVAAGEEFTIVVSTRNLVRDRFPPAGEGGYYQERSILNEDNLVRGHVHTACRMLSTTAAAPDPEPAPEAFAATEDGGGGEEPDQVAVVIEGLPEAGLAQCAVWAGDGSHRTPMMARPDQIPAFDSVRITVVGGDQDGGDQDGGDQDGGDQDGGDQDGGDQDGGDQDGGDQDDEDQGGGDLEEGDGQDGDNQDGDNQDGGDGEDGGWDSDDDGHQD
jgi:hypothetical protein